jgi:hypothetical protein
LYLSTSTHIKIYIVLTSNTQNPKVREMFFQRRSERKEKGEGDPQGGRREKWKRRRRRRSTGCPQYIP